MRDEYSANTKCNFVILVRHAHTRTTARFAADQIAAALASVETAATPALRRSTSASISRSRELSPGTHQRAHCLRRYATLSVHKLTSRVSLSRGFLCEADARAREAWAREARRGREAYAETRSPWRGHARAREALLCCGHLLGRRAMLVADEPTQPIFDDEPPEDIAPRYTPGHTEQFFFRTPQRAHEGGGRAIAATDNENLTCREVGVASRLGCDDPGTCLCEGA
jgi:hypothetical protein